jgi:hypothetical protein
MTGLNGAHNWPHECPLCHARLRTAAQLETHVCALTERFFQAAIPRWRARGVSVLISPTDYDGQQAGKDGR